MKMRLDELRMLIWEMIDVEHARSRFFALVQQAVNVPSAQTALFGYMRSVDMDDADIQRVRLLLKGTDRHQLVSYVKSLARSTFGD